MTHAQNLSEIPKIKWYYKLRFRILLFFIVLCISVVSVSSFIIHSYAQKMTDRFISESLEKSQKSILIGLSKQVEIAKSLVDAMVAVAQSIDFKEEQLHKIIPNLINSSDNKFMIAGGGIWPEPYVLSKNKERHSFFWGRDKQNVLLFYNDYNEDDGLGYHKEEWYVPARYLSNNQYYWSRSYTDPYSLQPMVTVTAPIIRNGKFIGAATVDLKLEGLQQLFAESTSEFNGYAFAMDRNGKLISFPDVTNHITHNDSIFDFENFSDIEGYLTEKELAFKSEQKHELSEEIMAIAKNISGEAHNISYKEAKKIALNIIKTNSNIENLSNNKIIKIEKDFLLNEKSLAVITDLPFEDWKIVTVIPEYIVKESFEKLSIYLNISTLILILISILVSWYLMKKLYLVPVEKLTSALINYKTYDPHKDSLPNPEKGEVELLNYLINERTKEVIRNKEEINKLAYYDSLTSLPNRRKLQQFLEEIIHNNKTSQFCHAVAFIDLDNFKNLNDSLGHHTGDKLLGECGKRFSSCIRENDMICRIGGDEFVIVFPNVAIEYSAAKAQLKNLSKRIIKALSRPFLLEENYYHVTASIGIHIFNNETTDSNTILKYADTAMYHSKEQGKNTFSFFVKSMKDKADYRLKMEKDLRSAIANNDLYLMYQPQISKDQKLGALEALIRWEHPSKGNIPTIEFINLAEESVLILSLGEWVIEKVCMQIKLWEKQRIFFEHVSINISPIQFKQPNFLDQITNILQKYNVSPKSIMLEVTEGVILENTDHIIKKIHQLKEIGFGISIDDFGTGYSSLSYLKRLPLDELKIDRSFVNGLNDDKYDELIVQSVISIAGAFGYDVIAEGVETQQQLEILEALGCYRYQGYFFSKPILANEVVEFLTSQKMENTKYKLAN